LLAAFGLGAGFFAAFLGAFFTDFFTGFFTAFFFAGLAFRAAAFFLATGLRLGFALEAFFFVAAFFFAIFLTGLAARRAGLFALLLRADFFAFFFVAMVYDF
jgi:hypothetical protein